MAFQSQRRREGFPYTADGVTRPRDDRKKTDMGDLSAEPRSGRPADGGWPATNGQSIVVGFFLGTLSFVKAEADRSMADRLNGSAFTTRRLAVDRFTHQGGISDCSIFGLRLN